MSILMPGPSHKTSDIQCPYPRVASAWIGETLRHDIPLSGHDGEPRTCPTTRWEGS